MDGHGRSWTLCGRDGHAGWMRRSRDGHATVTVTLPNHKNHCNNIKSDILNILSGTSSEIRAEIENLFSIFFIFYISNSRVTIRRERI